MRQIWITSDTHFNHTNILKFTNDQGKLIRGDRFNSVEEMNQTIVDRWNKLVHPQDIVYHLGDVYMGDSNQADLLLSRLMGRKRLILGNHDHGKDPVLAKHFSKIEMWRIFKEFNCVLTHVPIHPSSFRKVSNNVHGHIHANKSPDKQYRNVCVEVTDYTPVNIESFGF